MFKISKKRKEKVNDNKTWQSVFEKNKSENVSTRLSSQYLKSATRGRNKF